MLHTEATTDRLGRPVTVGMNVRVLEIPESLVRDLPDEERPEVQSMLGRVFRVYEIDEYGSAWVEKVWEDDDGSRSHSLALSPHEMEIA